MNEAEISDLPLCLLPVFYFLDKLQLHSLVFLLLVQQFSAQRGYLTFYFGVSA